MISLFESIHPENFRFRTVRKGIRNFSPPHIAAITLAHDGNKGYTPLVKVGDVVKTGELIAKSKNKDFPLIHASFYGRVIEIIVTKWHDKKIYHAIKIKRREGPEIKAYNHPEFKGYPPYSNEEILQKIHECGITGIHKRRYAADLFLKEMQKKDIQTVIINGVEDEPYLTNETRILTESPEGALWGGIIVAKLLGAKDITVFVEHGRRTMIENVSERLIDIKHRLKDINIDMLKKYSKYPEPSSGHIAARIAGRRFVAGKSPSDYQAIILDPSTLLAIYEAIYFNKPMIERVVTISGDCLENSENFRARIGTPIAEMVKICGGFKKQPAGLIEGGPMTGQAQENMEYYITKETQSIIFLSEESIKHYKKSECTRCARCIDICPEELAPIDIYDVMQRKDYHALKKLYVENCTNCGACTYICPSRISLSNVIAEGKAYTLK